jgi:hypothetical protein
MVVLVTRLLNRLPNTNIHYQIPASFEQTQRVPTGHSDVCLCDVSGATNQKTRISCAIAASHPHEKTMSYASMFLCNK